MFLLYFKIKCVTIINKSKLSVYVFELKGEVLMENSLAVAINVADSKVEYDENIKNILGEKEVLAWILKYTTSEFAELSIEEIMECIEGEPEISRVRVNPGESNDFKVSQRKITGTKNEDCVPNEGKIAFDIRFYAYVSGKRIKIILNLEAQKKFNPGYQIVTRGIFYGGRMISAQLDTEFEIPEYDNLKKVYSIWICMEAPQYIGNAISSYSLEKKDVVEGIPDHKQAYDKLSVVLVCLNEKMEKETQFLDMMNTLLSQTMDVEQKKKVLEEKFHFNMKSRLGERVNLMCNLSDLVEERGIVKGHKEGRLEERKESIRIMVDMLKDMGFTMESAVEYIAIKLKMNIEEVYEIAKTIKV